MATKAAQAIDYIQKTDLFGYQISLNLNKGTSTHKTVCGGLCSLLVYCFMAFYFYLNIYKLVNHQENFETSFDQLVTSEDLGEIHYSNETDLINFYVLTK